MVYLATFYLTIRAQIKTLRLMLIAVPGNNPSSYKPTPAVNRNCVNSYNCGLDREAEVHKIINLTWVRDSLANI